MDLFYGVFLLIDTIVYSAISGLYKVFYAVSSARLLTSDAYMDVANKVYVVIGVAMLFVVSYGLLRAIVDPDKATKGDLSGPELIKRIGIAVVGLAICPFVFNFLYQAQGLILEKNVIGDIFFRGMDESFDDGNGGNISTNKYIKDVGGSLTATSIWQAFFNPVEGKDPKDIEADPKELQRQYIGYYAGSAAGVVAAVAAYGGAGALATVGGTGAAATLAAAGAAALPVVGWVCLGAAVIALGFGIATHISYDKVEDVTGGKPFTLQMAYDLASSTGQFAVFQAFKENITADEPEIHYLVFLSTLAGLFTVYAFVSFTIDMGVRAAKLAFYQIIAPIPLVLQVVEKKRLNDFIKNILQTWIEVFVRIAVVFIVVYIICHLPDFASALGATKDNSYLNGIEVLLAQAAIIMGLVMFAKEAPKMISETFGIKGNVSLGLQKKLAEGGALTAGAAIGGGLTSLVRAGTHGFVGRDRWQNKDGNITAGSVVGNIARTIGSMGASTASGFVRSGYAAKGAKNYKDVGKAASDGAQAVTNKRDARERYWHEHGESVSGYVTGKAVDVKDNVVTWAMGPVDTSYDDKTISLYGSVVDERDKLRTKTGKYEQARLAETFLKQVQSQTVEEYNDAAYEAAVKAAADGVGPQRAGESDAAYSARVAQATQAIDRESFKNQHYSEEVAELQRRKNAANKTFEAIQDLGYAGLASFAKNGKGDAAARDELQRFFTANITELRARANDQIIVGQDSSGNNIYDSLSNVLASNYGLDLSTGAINWGVLKDRTEHHSQIKIDKVSGGKAMFDVTYDLNTGDIVSYVDTSGFLGRGVGATITADEFNALIDEHARDISNVSAVNAINDATDFIKDTKQAKASDPRYVRNKTRQSEQNSKKDK